jgi:hypothetical protein
MRQTHDQKLDENGEKKYQNKTQNSERNVRGSCGEGPET